MKKGVKKELEEKLHLPVQRLSLVLFDDACSQASDQ
jgi:hypothetical protein